MIASPTSPDRLDRVLTVPCFTRTAHVASLFSLHSVVFLYFFDFHGPLHLPVGICGLGSFVRYATAREGKTKFGFRSSPLKFLLLVGLAATGFRLDDVWQLPDLCRINHFINRHVSRRQS